MGAQAVSGHDRAWPSTIPGHPQLLKRFGSTEHSPRLGVAYT